MDGYNARKLEPSSSRKRRRWSRAFTVWTIVGVVAVAGIGLLLFWPNQRLPETPDDSNKESPDGMHNVAEDDCGIIDWAPLRDQFDYTGVDWEAELASSNGLSNAYDGMGYVSCQVALPIEGIDADWRPDFSFSMWAYASGDEAAKEFSSLIGSAGDDGGEPSHDLGEYDWRAFSFDEPSRCSKKAIQGRMGEGQSDSTVGDLSIFCLSDNLIVSVSITGFPWKDENANDEGFEVISGQVLAPIVDSALQRTVSE